MVPPTLQKSSSDHPCLPYEEQMVSVPFTKIVIERSDEIYSVNEAQTLKSKLATSRLHYNIINSKTYFTCLKEYLNIHDHALTSKRAQM